MRKKVLFNLNFFNLALLVFFTIETNYDWGAHQIMHWGVVGLLTLAYLCKDGGKLDFNFRDFSKWMCGLLILAVLSCFYTVNYSGAVSTIKNMIVVFVVFLIIRNYMTEEDKIIDVISCYAVSVIINMFYVIVSIDDNVIGSDRIGTEAIEGWNSNTIGIMAAAGALICIYLLIKQKGIINRVFFSVSLIFLIYMFLYTGSRKAIIMFVCCAIIMLFAFKPKAIFKNLIISILILSVFYGICMKVESVYNVLGVRLEGLVAGVTGEGEVDSSTEKRQEFIDNGVKWIKESPIIGYGLESYRYMNGKETGLNTYSHNNFIEIMINWGIVGFVYYYSIYLIVLKKMLKKVKSNLLGVSIFSLLVVNLILHYGMVAYYDLYTNLILCMACAFVSLNAEKKEESLDDKKNV